MMKRFLHPANAMVAVIASLLACSSTWVWSQASSASGMRGQGAVAGAPSLFVPASGEREKLLSEHFTEVRDAAAFPASCKSGFAALTRTHGFELANPGQPYQATDVMGRGPQLPWRRLLIGGVSSDRCIVFYEIGGFAPFRAVVVLDISAKTPTLVWGGAGGKNPADLRALISQIAEGDFSPSAAY